MDVNPRGSSPDAPGDTWWLQSARVARPGPYRMEDLAALATAGALFPGDLIRSTGDTAWRPVESLIPDAMMAGTAHRIQATSATAQVPGWQWPGVVILVCWLLGIFGVLIWAPLGVLPWLGVAGGLALAIRATIEGKRTNATAARHWICFGVAVVLLLPLSLLFFFFGFAIMMGQTGS